MPGEDAIYTMVFTHLGDARWKAFEPLVGLGSSSTLGGELNAGKNHWDRISDGRAAWRSARRSK